MSEFRRFSDGEADDPARALFRSMRDDAPSPGRKGDVLAAALAAAATVTVATTATAAVGAATASAAAAAAKVPVAGAIVSGVAPAAALPIAAATAAPATAALVPGVSVVKMIGAFLLGGAVTATGLVAGTQLLDPPTPARPATSLAAPLQTVAAPTVLPRAAREIASPEERRVEGEAISVPVVSVDAVRVAPSAPVAAPSARAEKADKAAFAEPPAPAPAVSIAPPSEPTLADEVSSLDGARRALSSGDGPAALRALDTFQGKFPRARLGTEALVLRVEALVASGRAGEARGLGDPFLAAHPDSPFAPRVRRAIGQKENVLTIP